MSVGSDHIQGSSPEDATGDDREHRLDLQGTPDGLSASEEASEGSIYSSSLYSPILTKIDRDSLESSCSAPREVDTTLLRGAREKKASETIDNARDNSNLVVLPYHLVKESVDTFFDRQYLPFPVINRELFMQDFLTGRHGHCSPALLRSICCLSCRILGGYDSTRSQHAALGNRLFEEATRLLKAADKSKYVIPDAQALGLLSLHQLGLGGYAEARELADESVRRIDIQYRQQGEEQRVNSSLQTTRATSLFGAISLAR